MKSTHQFLRVSWLLLAFIYCALAPRQADADLVPGCEGGYSFGGGPRTMTFTPNIQSFLNHNPAWTEAQIRRDLTAALEEWNAKGQANVRLVLSTGSTNLAGFKDDDLNVISICDPSVSCTSTSCCTAEASCGGEDRSNCVGGFIGDSDVVLYDKAESNCEWLLQHQINNDDDANVSVFRKVVHEVGHAVGIDHYSGGIYYATVIEGAGWWTAGIDFNKYNISWIDIAELRNIYGVRHSYIRWMTADDSGSPLDWPDTSSTGFGSTLSDVGALQNSQDTGYSVFFVRNSDNTQGGDAGNNSVTVYRDSGGWGHQTITAANSTGLRMLSGGALTRTDQEYVVAWHDHNNQLRRQRTIGGGPTNWTSSTPVGFYTTHTAAAACLASVDRLYLIWVGIPCIDGNPQSDQHLS